MARNQEKAQSMMNRYLKGKQDEQAGPKKLRPFLASECSDLQEADRWHHQIIREISRKVYEIQNAGLGEHRCAHRGCTLAKRFTSRLVSLLAHRRQGRCSIQSVGACPVWCTQACTASTGACYTTSSCQHVCNRKAWLGTRNIAPCCTCRLRDLNDEINKLMREKGHWEKRIVELGGPDYSLTRQKLTDADGTDLASASGRGAGYRCALGVVTGSRAKVSTHSCSQHAQLVVAAPHCHCTSRARLNVQFIGSEVVLLVFEHVTKSCRYFGAAKNLPGVKELFEKEGPRVLRRSRYDMHKAIDADYYGFRDEDDGVLVREEAAAERRIKRQVRAAHVRAFAAWCVSCCGDAVRARQSRIMTPSPCAPALGPNLCICMARARGNRAKKAAGEDMPALWRELHSVVLVQLCRYMPLRRHF